MPDTPRKYERRFLPLEVDAADGSRMWLVEQWVYCQCPDCDKEGHWVMLAIVREEKVAKRLSELKEEAK